MHVFMRMLNSNSVLKTLQNSAQLSSVYKSPDGVRQLFHNACMQVFLH